MKCPCDPTKRYQDCCEPYHLGKTSKNSQKNVPDSAEKLMCSRYSAFVLGLIDYIIDTTVPAQQLLLDKQSITDWSMQTNWQKLVVLSHVPNVGKRHAQVEFEAFYLASEGMQFHRELSMFVKIDSCWFFIDPTVQMNLTQKHLCICGSGDKLKRCCGEYI